MFTHDQHGAFRVWRKGAPELGSFRANSTKAYTSRSCRCRSGVRHCAGARRRRLSRRMRNAPGAGFRRLARRHGRWRQMEGRRYMAAIQNWALDRGLLDDVGYRRRRCRFGVGDAAARNVAAHFLEGNDGFGPLPRKRRRSCGTMLAAFMPMIESPRATTKGWSPTKAAAQDGVAKASARWRAEVAQSTRSKYSLPAELFACSSRSFGVEVEWFSMDACPPVTNRMSAPARVSSATYCTTGLRQRAAYSETYGRSRREPSPPPAQPQSLSIRHILSSLELKRRSAQPLRRRSAPRRGSTTGAKGHGRGGTPPSLAAKAQAGMPAKMPAIPGDAAPTH